MADERVWIERIEDAGSGVTYYGYAPSGTATDEAGWQIKRVTRSGDDVVEVWAGPLPNQVWDDRGSLTYG